MKNKKGGLQTPKVFELAVDNQKSSYGPKVDFQNKSSNVISNQDRGEDYDVNHSFFVN
jgi:hypothetical protein